MYLKQLFIVICLSTLVACTGAEERPDSESSRVHDCIHEPSIRGYRVLDEQNLIVDGSGRRSYHVVLWRRAHGISSSWGIGFKSPASMICSGNSEVVFRGNFNGESIRITSIRKLTPEEEEDLLIRFGKKEPEIEQTPAPQEVEGAEVEELDPATGE